LKKWKEVMEMLEQGISFLPIILLFVAFYFFLIRPQQRRQKERVQMLNVLKKGDKVVTIGGLHGVIVDLTEERAILKVSDNTRLTFERSAINAVVNAEESAPAEQKVDKVESEKL
jgi:preprotein translocase subunit YajC